MSELTDYEKLREKPSLFVEKVFGVSAFEYQKELLDADARHRVIASGRQVGKSRMCAWLGLHKAVTNPHTQVLITAPSLRQSSLLFNTLFSEIDQSALSNDEWGIERNTQTIIEFDNGSAIHCLPTGRDGSKIRGYTADMVIVDEAAFINDSIFGDILEPMLFATGGNMILASTPWGKSGFLYEKFQGAPSKKKWARVQASSYDNPLNDPEDLDEYKEGKTQSQIDREVLGKFVDDAGQFFPSDAIADCTPGGIPEREGDDAYLGVDIAGTGEDKTVFYGVDGMGNVFLNDERYEDMGVLEAAHYVKTLDNQYDFNRIFVDRTAIGQGTIETLANDPVISRKHEPIYFSVQKKQQIYQRLKAALEAGALHLPSDTQLRNELESIGSDQTRSGNLRLYPRGDAESKRDDNVDSLALAVWGMPEFGDNTRTKGARHAVSGRQQYGGSRRQSSGANTSNHDPQNQVSDGGTGRTRSYTVNNRGNRRSRNNRNNRGY